MRRVGSRHFGRSVHWITAMGLPMVIVVFMGPGASAQPSAADRSMHADCGAMTPAGTLRGAGGAAPLVSVTPGTGHSATAARSQLHALAQPLNIQPGQYEGTAEVSVPGGSMKMPPSTSTYCITAKDTQGWAKNQPAPPGYTCTITDYQQEGNKVTLTRVCKGKDNTATWHGEVTFASTSYSGVWNITNSSGRSSTIKFSAKRIGDCPK